MVIHIIIDVIMAMFVCQYLSEVLWRVQFYLASRKTHPFFMLFFKLLSFIFSIFGSPVRLLFHFSYLMRLSYFSFYLEQDLSWSEYFGIASASPPRRKFVIAKELGWEKADIALKELDEAQIDVDCKYKKEFDEWGRDKIKKIMENRSDMFI